MNPIINQVESGFQSILGSDVFSPDSKIAVMSTMHGDYDNLFATGLNIATYSGIEDEPGFLDFVNKAAIEKYRVSSPQHAGKWSIDGCQQKWFSPEDVDGNGVSCLTGAIQSSNTSTMAEAGIHAFEQLLLKNAGKATFRSNAIVNVIFVSDTHDPGVNNADLTASIRSYQDLDQMAKVDNRINQLRFHAIAPDTKCTSEELWDKSYYALVDASNGEKGDPCALSDYTDFLGKMIATSKIQSPRFALANRVSLVDEVRVNGQVWNDYELLADEQAVVLGGLDPKQAVSVEISYTELPETEAEEAGEEALED